MGSGPLSGVTVLEFAGIGPGPFCAMLLSDMGANVIRIDRKVANVNAPKNMPALKYDFMGRGRRSIAVDLKNPAAVELCLKLAEKADMMLEGFRPGVMERLGLGPDVMLKRNPKIVYGRMTGWGQSGPYANAVGHDINYGSITGAIHAIGPKGGKPTPPLALVGDLGGGGAYLALGMVSALVEARVSGKGQVVDAAMSDGVASLSTPFFGQVAAGTWDETERGSNMLDGGMGCYGAYETKDGKYVSIASIEPNFYDNLRKLLGLTDDAVWKGQLDPKKWPEQQKQLDAIFKTKTRDEWCEIMEGHEICFAPILTFTEAMEHPHNKARETFVEVDGEKQPAPAPRFSRTVSKIQGGAVAPGSHNDAILKEAGLSAGDIDELKKQGAI